MKKPQGLKETIDRFRGEGENLYAIVDAARDDHTYLHTRYNLKLEYQTLFQGKNAEITLHVAPILFLLPAKSEFFDIWADKLGNSSGVLLLSKSPFEEILKHLRMIFHVVNEDGDKFLFRFYDPRVFRPSVPTFDQDQNLEFFGPISRFFVEDEEANTLSVYSTSPAGDLLRETLTLTPFEPLAKHRHDHPPPKEEDKSFLSKFKKS